MSSKNKQIHEVIINGELYIPLKQAAISASDRAIKLALLKKFWGNCSNDSDRELNEKWEGVYIDVTDSPNPKCSKESLFTIDELLANIKMIQNNNG